MYGSVALSAGRNQPSCDTPAAGPALGRLIVEMPDNLRIELDIRRQRGWTFPRQIFIGGLHHLSQALDTRLNPLRCRQQFISGLCRLRVNIGDTIRGLLLHRTGQRGVDLRQRLLQAISASLSAHSMRHRRRPAFC